MKRIVSPKKLDRHAEKHPSLRATLKRWQETVEANDWKGPAALRRTYRDADSVKVASGNTVWVFNIKSHRLIASIHFNTGMVWVLRLMDHAEYDRDRWKDEL